MDDCLDCGNSRNRSMKNVKSPKTPTSSPEKRVISSAKKPHEDQICVSHYSCSVRKISPYLGLDIIPAKRQPLSASVSTLVGSIVSRGDSLQISPEDFVPSNSESKAEEIEECDNHSFDTGRNRAPV